MLNRIVPVVLVALCLGLNGNHAAVATGYTAAIVPPAGDDAGRAAGVSQAIAAAGYRVKAMDLAGLCNAAVLNPATLDLLVLCDGSALPANSVAPVHDYLKGGGDLIALNAPLWRQPLLQDGERWMGRDDYAAAHSADLIEHVLFDFRGETLNGWERTTNAADSSATHAVEADAAAPGGSALHVTIDDLTNWDTYVSPPLAHAFPDGDTLTVFHARGGPKTNSLAIEWQERDGSRWIATVALEPSWKVFVLAPEDFRYWESVPSRAGTRFAPENAVQLSVGLAFTHTGLDGGAHAYWAGPIGTAAVTPHHVALRTRVPLPALDTLAPEYKYFKLNGALAIEGTSFGIPGCALPATADVWAPHPRPQAAGFDKGRVWRWEPLASALEATQYRGAPVTLLVHAAGPYAGGVWAAFGVRNPAWYVAPEVQSMIEQTARRMRRHVFLLDAGAQFFTYFEGQTIRAGARVVNTSLTEPAVCTVMLPASPRFPIARTWELEIEPGGIMTVEDAYTPAAWPDDGYVLRVELREDDAVIDIAEHPIHMWRPKESPEYVSVQDGNFLWRGARWRPHGVNYMPSSGIGTEDQDYFEHWIGARAYDPVVIQRDLERCRWMGLNAVSIFIYHESLEAQNLLDLLRRLDALGMKANLSLRPGTPLDFEWDKIRALLEHYRIAEHDAVFALDLAWEPMWGDHEARRRWDPQWRAWIEERYGTIAHAERDWGYAMPRDPDGRVTNPLSFMSVQDGDWRRMTAAYRRFLDTVLYEYYSRARDLVREVDPHHLVSFRMTEAGNPTFRWDKTIPYAFPYLAAAVDIIEPEAYGRIGDWERVKPGWFEAAYARWAAPDLPMMWAEMGVHVWDMGRMCAADERLEFQAQYYRDFYRMLIGSGADGVFYWWYPGGYRVNERSDYGIIHPDGTARLVTDVIRAQANAFVSAPDPGAPTTWIEIDRDAAADGIASVYDAAQAEFWRSIEQDGTPGLRTAGTGSTSADCPLAAVGNTPCDGTNPPKYLDGFFDSVEVRGADGLWVAVQRGDTVRVAPGTPVTGRVQLTNLAEATWLAPKTRMELGAVYVVAAGAGTVLTPLPADMPRHVRRVVAPVALTERPVTETIAITLTLEARGRTPFGPKFAFNVAPAAP